MDLLFLVEESLGGFCPTCPHEAAAPATYTEHISLDRCWTCLAYGEIWFCNLINWRIRRCLESWTLFILLTQATQPTERTDSQCISRASHAIDNGRVQCKRSVRPTPKEEPIEPAPKCSQGPPICVSGVTYNETDKLDFFLLWLQLWSSVVVFPLQLEISRVTF